MTRLDLAKMLVCWVFIRAILLPNLVFSQRCCLFHSAGRLLLQHGVESILICFFYYYFLIFYLELDLFWVPLFGLG